MNGAILPKAVKPYISYKRIGNNRKDDILVILNMTPLVRNDWEIYVHDKSEWAEIFNSNNKEFWGTGDVYNPDIRTELVDEGTKAYKLTINLPALGAVVLR